MSFGALALKVTGTVMPVTATGPAFVQGNYALSSTASLTVPLPATATLGNLLSLACEYNAGTQTPSLTGWTPVPGSTIVLSGARTATRFTKVSDGTETGATINFGASAQCSGVIAEYSNAKAGTCTSATFVVRGTGAGGGAFGPSDAPVSSLAIPEMVIGITGVTTLTFSSPWITEQNDDSNVQIAGLYQPAPNAAASGTAYIPSSSLNAIWSNLWIEPK